MITSQEKLSHENDITCIIKAFLLWRRIICYEMVMIKVLSYNDIWFEMI